MIADRLKLTALRLLPKNTVSRALGAVSEIPLPPGMRSVVNTGFATAAGVDIDEAQRRPGEYGSLNDFFTRRLRDGARQVAARDDHDLVCPSDGRLDQFGPIQSDTLVQAKGRTYRLVDLLDSGRDASQYRDGYYATIYLSPRDYHRVHSPVTGTATRLGYVPGHLFPVNPFAVQNIDHLFAVNERLTTYLQTAFGSVATVMVGATCVGRITLSFHPYQTNTSFRRREDVELSEPVDLAPGDELGVFNLGSTVILLIQADEFEFEPTLERGASVRMGERLGRAAG